MFNFLKKEAILDAKKTEAKLSELLKSAGEEIWIISPFCEMDKLSYLRRQIGTAVESGTDVNFIVRDEAKQTDPATKALADLMDKGLSLGAVHRLHAKIYWSDKEAILSSANLLDGSFDKSLEVGLWLPTGHIHEMIRDFIRTEIEPNIRDLGQKRPAKTRPKKRQQAGGSSGFCIRCSEAIPLNADRPLCSSDYRKWAQYENLDYPEGCCHGCGKESRTTMRKPLCSKCFKTLAA